MNEDFEGIKEMRKNYLAIASLLIATVCSASAQERDLQHAGTGSSTAQDRTASSVSPSQLNEQAKASADLRSGSQEANRPAEALIFKPIPGDPKNRMAEFITPKGVRMRAITNGPDDIHFTPVDQTQMFADIYLHSPRAVEKLSGGVGATIDLFGNVGGMTRWFGGSAKVSNCKVTTTVVIDENGKTTTTIKTTCDIK